MTRNAATRATVLLAASLLLCAPALAGDRAEFQPLGFSEDGRYFAFEEFGVQDGSGFPYSNIFIIDLPADRWVPGTPVRVRLDEDGARLHEARSAAMEQALPALGELAIEEAASILALNGDGDPEAAYYGLPFGRPGYGVGQVEDEQLLTLELLDLPTTADCSIIDGDTKGFALSLDGVEIQRDTAPLPRSRGCPMDYRLYAVVAPMQSSMTPAERVAIISVYPFGFEGPDRRFLAVPLGR